MGTITAPTPTAAEEAAAALAEEQARIDAGAELTPPPETADRSYDDLADLTEEQRLIAGDCRTRAELEEFVDECRAGNEHGDVSEPNDEDDTPGKDDPPAPAPEAEPDPPADPPLAENDDPAAEVEAAVDDLDADGDGGAPKFQQPQPTAAEKLAGGPPMQQTIDGDEERHPVAADETDKRDDADLAMILTGTGQLGWAVGGKKPTAASLRLVGGAFGIEKGQLDKGSDVLVIVKGRVKEVAFKDKLDTKTRDATVSERDHKAQIIGANLAPDGYRAALVPIDSPALEGEHDSTAP